MENNDKWGILIVVGLLVGLFFLAKKSNPVPAYYEPYEPGPEPLPPSPPKFRPIAAPAAAEGHRYHNAETWDIEWNADGLPSKVTIHRDATQT